MFTYFLGTFSVPDPLLGDSMDLATTKTIYWEDGSVARWWWPQVVSVGVGGIQVIWRVFLFLRYLNHFLHHHFVLFIFTYFFGCATWLTRSLFPDQGLNPGPW